MEGNDIEFINKNNQKALKPMGVNKPLTRVVFFVPIGKCFYLRPY